MDQYPTHPVFDPILVAEHDCQVAKGMTGFGINPDTRYRAKKDLEKAQAHLYELIDALSLDELKAYGEYRKIFAK